MEVKEHIKKLLQKAGDGILEKDQQLALALLSVVAGESIFLLGPPGTAKSMIARRLKEMFREKKSFEYLMSRFSTPDEIFGPVSIQKLKDEDRYHRNIEGFLPWATVVFLDEIWKAGPAIQNALLTVLNEKIYQNGAETIRLPLKGIIAASNELPAKDQGLEALWDRFLIRTVSKCISDEKIFYAMMTMKEPKPVEIENKLLLTDAVIAKWQKEVEDVKVSDSILHSISFIRRKLKEESEKNEVKPLDYYISDRRWRKAMHLLKTSAFLNGRDFVDVSDLMLLIHVLWNTEEAIPTIVKIVLQAIYGEQKSELEELKKEDIDSDKQLQKVQSKFEKIKNEISERQEQIKNCQNIFLSEADKKLLKEQSKKGIQKEVNKQELNLFEKQLSSGKFDEDCSNGNDDDDTCDGEGGNSGKGGKEKKREGRDETNYNERNALIEEIARTMGRKKDSTREYDMVSVSHYLPELLSPSAICSDVDGVSIGNNIPIALPSEIAQMAEPQTEWLFYEKYATSKLQQFSCKALEGNAKKNAEKVFMPRPEKGPMVICIDTSGSMLGIPLKYAKAVVRALAKIAKEENRKCYLVSWSIDIKCYDLAAPGAYRNLNKFLSSFFSDGTDDTKMLSAVFAVLDTEDYGMADTLVISDFEIAPPSDNKVEQIKLFQEEGTRFYGLEVRTKLHHSNPYIKCFDKIWKQKV